MCTMLYNVGINIFMITTCSSKILNGDLVVMVELIDKQTQISGYEM